MSGQSELRGTLHVQESKKGRSFQVSYTNPKGRSSRMPVLPKVIFFDSEKAAEGDEVVFILNTNGQIEKCSIPGKEAEPVKKPVGAGGDRDRKPHYGTAGGRSYDGQAFGNRKNYGGSRIAGSGHSVAQNSALCDARAPYNFIPYEPKAVLTEENSEYGAWSGILHCSLEAITPLLVAGERIRRADESTECHFFQVEGKHVIPGSSIKGVLRSMVEILSFSAMRQVSRKELFWRIVTGKAYRDAFKGDSPDEILGGYLHRTGADYELFPASVRKVAHGQPALGGGRLVKTGGMSYKDRKTGESRISHNYSFSAPVGKAVPVSRDVVAVFERQMTENQKTRWKSELCSKDFGHPVFYRKDAEGTIVELGLCRYFRLRYDRSPAELVQAPAAMDFAERLFGKVGSDGAVKGRIAIEPAFVEGKAYREGGCCAILGTPHPTCLAHYVVQNPSWVRTIPRGTKNDPESLVGYRSGARLRGWKMYWHHDVDESLCSANPDQSKSNRVKSWLYPLAAGATAKVKIHIDRLTDRELGAVLEALSLASGDHALKLGMGKSLGFGSVRLKLERAEVQEERSHYASLVDRLKRGSPCLDSNVQENLRMLFRQNRLERLHALHMWKDVCDYNLLPPVKALRLMTDFSRRPEAERVKQMGLKDFARKALLMSPEEVLKRS